MILIYDPGTVVQVNGNFSDAITGCMPTRCFNIYNCVQKS